MYVGCSQGTHVRVCSEDHMRSVKFNIGARKVLQLVKESPMKFDTYFISKESHHLV